MKKTIVCAVLLGLVLFVPWLPGGSITQIAYNTIENAGTALTKRAILNMTGTGINCADDAGNSRTNCTVNGTGVANYAQTFVAQTSVALTHNFGTTSVLTQCYDNATPRNFIIPQNIAITDANTVTATFTAAQTGECIVGSGGSGAVVAFLSGSGVIDFGSINDGACLASTFTLTGALAGDKIAPGWPATLETGLFGNMIATAADTITVRLCNLSGGSVDPASQTFSAEIVR